MPSSHLILRPPLLLLPSIFPSIPYVSKVSTFSECSLQALTSKHPLLVQRRREVAKTSGPFPVPHRVLYIHNLSRHSTHSLKRTRVFSPMWGRVSLSDVWAVSRDELTLPTGPCSACPPTGEHLCEHLPDDADHLWGLGPIWHLECNW